MFKFGNNSLPNKIFVEVVCCFWVAFLHHQKQEDRKRNKRRDRRKDLNDRVFKSDCYMSFLTSKHAYVFGIE